MRRPPSFELVLRAPTSTFSVGGRRDLPSRKACRALALENAKMLGAGHVWHELTAYIYDRKGLIECVTLTHRTPDRHHSSRPDTYPNWCDDCAAAPWEVLGMAPGIPDAAAWLAV